MRMSENAAGANVKTHFNPSAAFWDLDQQKKQASLSGRFIWRKRGKMGYLSTTIANLKTGGIRMLYVDNKGITDPRINLAIEEYILKHLDINESYLLFYVNGPSIIIGRNQNTIEEINTEYVEKNNVIVVRRMSGGGAVYHDLGNLNYSFITKERK